MNKFNVIWYNINSKKFEAYDVLPYFINEYNNSKNKPKTFEEFKEFIISNSRYMYWARCQYEIIICGWPNEENREKWDIHKQIMMNIDIIVDILMDNINGDSK